MDPGVAGVIVGVLTLGALGAAAIALHVAYRRGWRLLRAIQIAEMALFVADNGGPPGAVATVRRKLHDLKWEVGIEDNVLAPPVVEDGEWKRED